MLTEELIMDIFDQDAPYDSPSSIFEGLQILRKYDKDADITAADHDMVYVESISGLIEMGITIEDLKKLRYYDWIIDRESDSLAHYV